LGYAENSPERIDFLMPFNIFSEFLERGVCRRRRSISRRSRSASAGLNRYALRSGFQNSAMTF
jgi:hypothetical protein